jgi:CBS domain-containing protein
MTPFGAWPRLAALAAVLGGVVVMANTGLAQPNGPALTWTPTASVATVVDVAGPRRDGTFVVATAGRLSLLAPDGTVRPFARGSAGYRTALGTEPYVTVTPDQTVDGADCAFQKDEVYALEPAAHPGVVVVDADGRARHAVTLPAGDVLTGITFDAVGTFGHRVLVTARARRGTALFAIDCDGHVRVITNAGPRVEGGLVIAPLTFGRFAGDLIAPDELSGRIVAFDPAGRSQTVAVSGLPTGGDVGVESAGFVPADFRPTGSALVADRHTPHNAHPGTDHVLRIAGAALLAAGVEPGDLVVVTEGGAETVAIRCADVCTVRRTAAGPAVSHVEGHVSFVDG